MQKILLVEDDKDISTYYVESLQQAGFSVSAFDNSDDVIQNYEKIRADLVILDIVLNDDKSAGFNLCKKIRSISQDVPIIFLSSLESEQSKISGMLLDANDYITKDVSVDYLIIRIKALLHRVNVLLGKNKSRETNKLILGNLYINLDTLTVKWKNKLVDLNLTQIWMVNALAHNKNCMCTAKQLMDAANIVIQPESIVGYIRKIRKSFQDVDKDFSALKNERSIGYRWVVED